MPSHGGNRTSTAFGKYERTSYDLWIPTVAGHIFVANHGGNQTYDLWKIRTSNLRSLDSLQ
jgi:uncharacterized protein YgiB involved in biofilm formation